MAESSLNHFYYSLKPEQYDLLEQTLNNAYALSSLLFDAATFQEIDWGNAPHQSTQVRVVGMQLAYKCLFFRIHYLTWIPGKDASTAALEQKKTRMRSRKRGNNVSRRIIAFTRMTNKKSIKLTFCSAN